MALSSLVRGTFVVHCGVYLCLQLPDFSVTNFVFPFHIIGQLRSPAFGANGGVDVMNECSRPCTAAKTSLSELSQQRIQQEITWLTRCRFDG